MAWKRLTSPVAKKFESQSSVGRIMLTLFWDMEGAILVHLTPMCPDLAPSDSHMFGPMKEALRRRRKRRFSSDEIIGTVQNWLKTQSEKELKKTCETLEKVR
jgi:hypothetical protein